MIHDARIVALAEGFAITLNPPRGGPADGSSLSYVARLQQ
jgi:hypothetical protein